MCADCLRAKAFFEATHIAYLQIGIEEDDEATRFIAEINQGFHSVSTIIFPDGAVLVDPIREELRRKLYQ